MVLTGAPAVAGGRARVLANECHAPHLFDAEIGQAIRGRVRGGELQAPEAPGLPCEVDLL